MQESIFVVKELLRRTQAQNIPLQDCAILYRTNAQSRAFEDALLKYKIPYKIRGSLSFYQRREVKDILSLLRMVVSDSDYLSFARSIILPKRGIGQATLVKLRDAATDLSLPILSLVRDLLSKEIQIIKFTKRQQSGVVEYLHILQTLKDMVSDEKPLEEIIQEAISCSSYEQVLREDSETYEDRKNNLEALINKAAEWRAQADNPTLVAFLEELSLRSSLEEQSAQDSVLLMTLHNGKGLEFTLTFLVGMEEDLLPHINSKNSKEAIEEERRLCYVGMTRAKRVLCMTASKKRFIWGRSKKMRRSRFLDEIPDGYLNKLNTESGESWTPD